jgi:putative sterol carrier protein
LSTSFKVKDKIVQIIEKIRSNEACRNVIAKWVNTYYGKIITIKADDEATSLVFTDEGNVKVLNVELPSPDVALIGSGGDLYSLLDGKASAKKLAISGQIKVRGSLHEWSIFEGILHSACYKSESI